MASSHPSISKLLPRPPFHTPRTPPPQRTRDSPISDVHVDAGGFYNLFDTQEITKKPWKRQYTKDKLGYEKPWRPGKAKVDGAGEASLQSGFMCWTNDKWRPCVKHVYDRGFDNMYIQDIISRTRRKHIEPQDHNAEPINKNSRRKLIKFERPSENIELIPSRKGPGKFKVIPQWEPPFRKGSKDTLLISNHRRKHMATYKDAFASNGVTAAFDPNASLPPVIGKRHLKTYSDQTLSPGVGALLQFPKYDFIRY